MLGRAAFVNEAKFFRSSFFCYANCHYFETKEIKMKFSDGNRIYRLTADLLTGIQNGEMVALSDFGITAAIYEEIKEELERSGENVENLTMPPYAIAFQADRMGRIPLYSYETEADPLSKRVACQLWCEGLKTELTLIADYSEGQREASLIFRLLETQ